MCGGGGGASVRKHLKSPGDTSEGCVIPIDAILFRGYWHCFTAALSPSCPRMAHRMRVSG